MINKGNTWFLSDPHFSHEKILIYEPTRVEVLGKTIEEHDEELIRRFNSKVRPTDLTYFLGDIGFGSMSYITSVIGRLNGEKILVLGNHDKHKAGHYRRMGFICVCYGMEIKIGKNRVLLSHYPYRKPWWKTIWPWSYVEKDRHKRPHNNGRFLIHGHIHSGGHPEGAWRVRGRQINVGVDANNYYPISIAEISNIIDEVIKNEIS